MIKHKRQASASEVKLRAQRLSNRGADYLRRGEAHNAISTLNRAHKLMPNDVLTAINLGGAYILAKKFALAIPILVKASEQEPRNEMIWTNLGAAYLGNPILAQDDQQRKAIQAFERAIEINPVTPNVHYNLGLIHRDRGEIEQAILRFRQAVQTNPHDRDACRALGRLEDQQNDGAERTESSAPRKD